MLYLTWTLVSKGEETSVYNDDCYNYVFDLEHDDYAGKHSQDHCLIK